MNTGDVFFGNLGSQQVFYYSVMGVAVNLSARLETVNKQYGSRFLVSEYTVEKLPVGKFLVRPMDMVKVEGKSQAVKIFEVYGMEGDAIKPDTEEYFRNHKKGFEAYLLKEWSSACKYFEAALTVREGDLAARNMIDRIEQFKETGVPDDWDGSFTLARK